MDINLSDSESRYYNDLFTLCDVEKTGKIQNLKALEFFRSSNVDNSVLSQVSKAYSTMQVVIATKLSQLALSQCERRKITFFWEGQHFFSRFWIFFLKSSAEKPVKT